MEEGGTLIIMIACSPSCVPYEVAHIDRKAVQRREPLQGVQGGSTHLAPLHNFKLHKAQSWFLWLCMCLAHAKDRCLDTPQHSATLAIYNEHTYAFHLPR